MATPSRSLSSSASTAKLSRSASASPVPVQGALVSSLDNAHASLSDLAAAPLTTTHQALDQTRSGLHSTARLLSDATQNLVRSQRNMQTLIHNIKNVQEFLPNP
ncbi:unnamed protein product [Mortierella alpina]